MLACHRRIFALVAFLVLATPLVVGLVRPDSPAAILKEGRSLAPAPRMPGSSAGWLALPGQVDAYLRDHFGLRAGADHGASGADQTDARLRQRFGAGRARRALLLSWRQRGASERRPSRPRPGGRRHCRPARGHEWRSRAARDPLPGRLAPERRDRLSGRPAGLGAEGGQVDRVRPFCRWARGQRRQDRRFAAGHGRGQGRGADLLPPR